MLRLSGSPLQGSDIYWGGVPRVALVGLAPPWAITFRAFSPLSRGPEGLLFGGFEFIEDA